MCIRDRCSTCLKRVGADLTAKYVGFKCADDYYTSIDMPTEMCIRDRV